MLILLVVAPCLDHGAIFGVSFVFLAAARQAAVASLVVVDGPPRYDENAKDLQQNLMFLLDHVVGSDEVIRFWRYSEIIFVALSAAS